MSLEYKPAIYASDNFDEEDGLTRTRVKRSKKSIITLPRVLIVVGTLLLGCAFSRIYHDNYHRTNQIKPKGVHFEIQGETLHQESQVEKHQQVQDDSLIPKVTHLPPGANFTYRFHRPSKQDDTSIDINNSTFGFQKIYILSMKRRTDKRAELTLLASEYGLDIEFVDGVEGRDLLPDEDHIIAGMHGTAEGHSRCWQKAIEDKVTTALIYEDDFDFDVRIRQQLRDLQDPLETFLMLMSGRDSIPSRTTSDPWHSSRWDLLWLGNQLEKSYPADGPQPYITYQDTTTIKPKDEYAYVEEILKDYGFGPEREKDLPSGHVRVIQEVKFGIGFHGYAVSQLGARKLLYAYTHKDVISHIDFLTNIMANEKKLRAYSLIPGIFSQLHSPVGSQADSDRQHTHVRLAGAEGVSPGIDQSAKKSLWKKIESHTET